MSIVDYGKYTRDWLVNATMPTKFVFHHVPKCGGTSVGRALRKRYILSQVTVRPDESFYAFQAYKNQTDREALMIDVASLREQMLLYHMFCGERCVSLHVPFSEIAYNRFSNEYKFITILREPVSRFISHFFWSYNKENDYARIDEDLESFLGSDRAKRMGASFVEYYSGSPSSSDLHSDELVRRAIDNLENKFDVVGDLSNLDKFKIDLKEALGLNVRVGHENKARVPNAKRDSLVSDATLNRIREVCSPDIQIWNEFKSRCRSEA